VMPGWRCGGARQRWGGSGGVAAKGRRTEEAEGNDDVEGGEVTGVGCWPGGKRQGHVTASCPPEEDVQKRGADRQQGNR